MEQTAYDRFEMKVHRGSGSLLVVLPYRLCQRLHIRPGDTVLFDRPEGKRRYSFYKQHPRSSPP